jgi:hypothetical protein
MKLFILCFILFVAQALHAELVIQPFHKNYSWKSEWTQSLKSELSKEEYKNSETALLNIEVDEEDLDDLECDGYNKAGYDEKIDFWVTFLSSLSRAESGFNPKAASRKTRGHRSYGLLQLAKQTAAKECGLDPRSRAVFNAEENLICGVKLIQWQLQGAPTKSGRKLRSDLQGELFGKYIFQWGPLRQNDHRGRKLLVDWFKDHLSQLPFCDTRTAH